MKDASFVLDFDFDLEEATSSVSLNPDAMTFAKFVFTDDKPNANKQRVPETEFDNIVKTGIFMPFKMGDGQIEQGHKDAKPIGVIAQLKKENNQVKGIAGLWTREASEEIALLKEMVTKDQLPQLSWELLYSDSSVNDDGVEDLQGVVTKGICVVGMPAYKGRTPIIAMASEEQGETVEELELLKQKVQELEALIQEKDSAIAEKETLLSDKEAEISNLKSENSSLSEYKSAIEAEAEKKRKVKNIKEKFNSCSVAKEDAWFEENEEKLLNMSESELDFMLQEMVAFASQVKETTSGVKVPPITSTAKNVPSDPKQLGQLLRKSK